MSQPSQPEVVHFVGNSFAYASPGHLIAVGAVLPAIGIIIVIIRFYTRKLKKLKYGIDDYLILPALLFVIGMGAAIIAGKFPHSYYLLIEPSNLEVTQVLRRELLDIQRLNHQWTRLLIIQRSF